MRVLFLGGAEVSPLVNWLIQQKETVWYARTKLTSDEVRSFVPDIIVSYNYRHFINEEIRSIPQYGVINLHISYLPFNRGADPNPWSFIDNTPTGVTIHHVGEGIDTGDIIIQSEIEIDKEKETLASSYKLLHDAIQKLFRAHWYKIRTGSAPRHAQKGRGTYHKSSDNARFMNVIEEYGWGIPITKFLAKVCWKP